MISSIKKDRSGSLVRSIDKNPVCWAMIQASWPLEWQLSQRGIEESERKFRKQDSKVRFIKNAYSRTDGDQLTDNTGVKGSATKISNQLFIITQRKQRNLKNQEFSPKIWGKLQIIMMGQPRSLLWNILCQRRWKINSYFHMFVIWLNSYLLLSAYLNEILS